MFSAMDLDAPICDIAAPGIKGALLSGDVLAGRDEFCMEYIEKITNI